MRRNGSLLPPPPSPISPLCSGWAAPTIRRAAAQDTPPDAPVAIIESETGSGKTEVALQSSRAAVVRQALETVPRGF